MRYTMICPHNNQEITLHFYSDNGNLTHTPEKIVQILLSYDTSYMNMLTSCRMFVFDILFTLASRSTRTPSNNTINSITFRRSNIRSYI